MSILKFLSGKNLSNSTPVQPGTVYLDTEKNELWYDDPTNDKASSHTKLFDSTFKSIDQSLANKAPKEHNHNASEINAGILSLARGGTGGASAAEALQNLGVTATATELNKLDGATISTTELNYVKGVTSAIQTQLNNKINTSAIVNNLTTNDSSKVLSAAQGVVIKSSLDKKASQDSVDNHIANKSNPHGVTAAQAGAIPLSGVSDYTISGNLLFSDTGTSESVFRGMQGKCGNNDYWRVGGRATGSNAGYMEISTSDDGTEPIYVRQYTGVYSSLVRTATLLDANGNTSFPGTVSVAGLNISNKVNLNYNSTDQCLNFTFI